MGCNGPRSSREDSSIIFFQGSPCPSRLFTVFLRRAAAIALVPSWRMPLPPSQVPVLFPVSLSSSRIPPSSIRFIRKKKITGFDLLGSSEQGASFPGSRLHRRPRFSQEYDDVPPLVLTQYLSIYIYSNVSSAAYLQSLLRRSTRRARAPPPWPLLFGMPTSAPRSTSPPARAAPTSALSSSSSSASPWTPRMMTVLCSALLTCTGVLPCHLIQTEISPSSPGETPLIHATRQGHLQTAQYLLDHGANPSVASNLGATALHHAAGIGKNTWVIHSRDVFLQLTMSKLEQ